MVHPTLAGVRDGSHVQYNGAPTKAGAHDRTSVIMAPGGADRFPCGTGTSARTAGLVARGDLAKPPETSLFSTTLATFTAASTITAPSPPSATPRRHLAHRTRRRAPRSTRFEFIRIRRRRIDRAGVAHAAPLFVDLDTILVVGALVAAKLCGLCLPIANITRRES